MYLGLNLIFIKLHLIILSNVLIKCIFYLIYFGLISSNIPLSDNNSLLASMVYYGKIHYMISSMLPSYNSHVIMGYPKIKCSGALGMKRYLGLFCGEQALVFFPSNKNKMRFIEDAPFSKFYTSFDRKVPVE